MEHPAKVRFDLSDIGSRCTAYGICGRHGAWRRETFVDLLERTECPMCASERKLADAVDEDRKNKAAAYRNAGVSERHSCKDFASFNADDRVMRNHLEVCRDLVQACVSDPRGKRSLILMGKAGTGKTHLGCAMVMAMIDNGKTAVRVRFMDFMQEIFQSWKERKNENKVIEYYAHKDLLVIDEIGVQHGNDTERMMMFDIIDRRYELRLPTVLITNLDMDKLVAEVGERVISRLREDGGRLLTFAGDDVRGKIQ